MIIMTKIQGFNQFSEKEMERCNFALGCKNDCMYCHQKYRHLIRRKLNVWNVILYNLKKIHKFRISRKGKVCQIPTTSDIFEENVDLYIKAISNALEGGYDEIQITTKARFDCIVKICNILRPFSDRIHFFFTITTDNDDLIKIYERNSSHYVERKCSLAYAFGLGFKTSLLIEPFLSDPRPLVKDLSRLVTNKIYIGKMNYITQLRNAYYNYEYRQSFDDIEQYYKEMMPVLKDDPLLINEEKIVWKK